MWQSILFIVFPYVAVVLAVVVGIYRYVSNRFSYSSLSSQFLEKGQQFWGSVYFHYGLVLILLAHLLAALFPRAWGALLSEPVRLYVLEISGLALGAFVLIGVIVLLIRRGTNPRVRVVTSVVDWIVLALLLVQAITGLHTALAYRWGGLWYLHTAVPWLWSLATLNPQISTIAALPWMAKIHFFNAFLLIALFPFSRLVHIFTVPLSYLVRPYQVVIWNRRSDMGRAIRNHR